LGCRTRLPHLAKGRAVMLFHEAIGLYLGVLYDMKVVLTGSLRISLCRVSHLVRASPCWDPDGQETKRTSLSIDYARHV